MSIQGYKVPTDNGGFDLTPMIDVVFLLIVFFMTVASMLTADKIDMNLAVAEEAAIPKLIEDRYTFSVTNEGRFYAGPEEVTLEELGEVVARIGSTRQNVKIVLRADRMAEHKDVNRVLTLCAQNGINNIIFATYQSDL